VKKKERKAPIRPDESRPTKIVGEPEKALSALDASDIPAYRGQAKTHKMPKSERVGRGDRVKAKFAAAAVKRPRQSKEVDFGDQQPRRPRSRGAGSPREQYIRLRIRVNNGRLSVVDSHLVDGPLGQERGFPGSNAYEVTLGDRLLHAGALPDLGVQRSFPNVDGPPRQHGHYFTERTTYEFTARLPADAVTRDTVKEIAVRLHRVKQEARTDQLGEAPLAMQFERQLRPIAELVGLPDSVLPEAIERRGGRTPSA
jgi:hypothetical protein